ncbi:phage tail collar domain-containing protein [Caballeronia pedi]|uniref:Phage tail collar domain-containing protein n=1 Tax=Caballeronia pedi TaxID=1777141 RepID=A0A158DVH1_9BURK|nr:pyocin knob domain-containing protein [Caballeronia pedi]SAK98595.1 phage tail collar domain-containing protein [Caballeronia pedi]
MANQPEAVQYDAGVYQLEAVDPVDGGVGAVSNKPLLNLANRTAYLKQHVDALESSAAGLAPINSPTFTGTPAAPTPALGDNTTKIATTAFVQGTVNGITTKSVAGGANVTLTAVEAGRGILKLTGAITANIAVIVPASSALYTVWNSTTGAYTLTVKTASGTGVAVTQGQSVELFCDGTNVLTQTTDFPSIALTGSPTAPTPTTSDNSTLIATTAFAHALAKSYGLDGVSAGTGSITSLDSITLNGLYYNTANISADAHKPPIGGNTGYLLVVNHSTAGSPYCVQYWVSSTGSDQSLCVRRNVNGTWDSWRVVAFTDSPTFTGTPTAPTAAQFDSSTLIATTAFVQRSLGNFSALGTLAAAATLTASDVGKMIALSGATNYTVTLPAVSGNLPAGAAITFVNMGTGNVTIAASGGTIARNSSQSGLSSFVLGPGDSAVLTTGVSGWYVSGGSCQAQTSVLFGASLSNSGYQKLPSGLIVQWGVFSVAANVQSATVTYPIAFSTGAFSIVATRSLAGNPAASDLCSTAGVSASQFQLYKASSVASVCSYVWIAIGV